MEGADHGGAYGDDEEVIGYFMTGQPISFDFVEYLHSLSPRLKEVLTVEKCKVVLAFCDSETNSSIDSVLQYLQITPDTKPVLLVVLHNADPLSIPDSSRPVSRLNTLTVDCLISKDNELLQCQRNSEAKSKVHQWIIQMIEEKKPDIQDHGGAYGDDEEVIGYFMTGQPISFDFVEYLHSLSPRLKEVLTVEKCKVVLAFCDSETNSSIDSVLQYLQITPDTKPVLLVVLHNADPLSVPDSSRPVSRLNTLTVDCLISKDNELLQCQRNSEAKSKVQQWIIQMIEEKKPDIQDHGGAYGDDEEVIGYFMTGQPISFDFVEYLHSLSPRLKEVLTVEKCKVVLAFCDSKTNSSIDSVLQYLQITPDTKPVLLVVLHNADPLSVPDSSRPVSRLNTLTVDCLISKDNELLQCQRNSEAKSKVQQWIIQMIEEKKPDIQDHGGAYGNDEEVIGYFMTGQPISFDFVEYLHSLSPRLKEVLTVEKCKVVLAFCDSETNSSIDSVLQYLQITPDTKPVLLVVLHNADPLSIPDSSRPVSRLNTLTVDCLISKDNELLQCQRNSEAKSKVQQWIIQMIEEKKPDIQKSNHTSNPKNINLDIRGALTRGNMLKVDCLFHENEKLLQCPQNETSLCTVADWLIAKVRKERKEQESHDPPRMPPEIVKIFSRVSGNTLGFQKEFVRMLCTCRPDVQEVLTVEECDVILSFCPVVSRAGTDIEAALQNLNNIPVTKDVVLVVLHHTFNPESIIPDSNREVSRKNTFTVDCLFQKDSGFLHCSKNDHAFRKVLALIETKGTTLNPPKPSAVIKETKKKESRDPPRMPPKILKIFSHVSGNTLGFHMEFVRMLCTRRPDVQEVLTVEECDVILCFCPVVSRAGTDIEAALQNLSDIPVTKDVVLVVLHHTFNPESIIPDSNREVSRKNTFTVDCLFHEDSGFLHCSKNDHAFRKVLALIETKGTTLNPPKPSAVIKETKKKESRDPPRMPPKILKIFSHVSGNTLGFHMEFVRMLCTRRPDVQEVLTVEECDVILCFCPVVSRAGTDIEAALQNLSDIPVTKDVVLVVLHHTFNPESIIPDSNREVSRKNTFTVDCLFHEDSGFLHCSKNDHAFRKVLALIETKGTTLNPPKPSAVIKETKKKESRDPPWMPLKIVKIFSRVSGNTLGFHMEFVRMLCTRRPDVQEVLTVEECDVILCFCPVVSRAGTDIEAALQNLSDIPVTKDVVLVVLHHTFNPESIIPDSNREVSRKNTFTVDCLFHEDSGFLHCSKNDHAFRKVLALIETKGTTLNPPKPSAVIKETKKKESRDPPWMPLKIVKIFSRVSGNTLGFHMEFVRMLCTRRPDVQEVLTVEECDVILCFCPVVSRAGTDIEAALQNLSDIPVSKDVVLVVLHHTFNPESIIPDSNREVSRKNTLTVDCLFHEDSGFLHCSKNDHAFRKVLALIETKGTTLNPQKPSTAGRNKDSWTGKGQNRFENLQKSCEANTKTNEVPWTGKVQKGFESLKEKWNKTSQPRNKGSSYSGNKSEPPSPQRNKGSSSFFLPQMVECPGLPQVKLFSLVLGKTLGSHKDFVTKLCNRRPGLREVSTVEECDVILGFCPVVYQAETDVTAALRQLHDVQGSKPVVLVVLHHTFDPETMVPDSSRSVTKKDTLAVDCLFHEDKGILCSVKNEEVFSRVSAWIEAQPRNKSVPPLQRNKGSRSFSLQKKVEHPGLSHVKLFSLILGKTLGSHKDFVTKLCNRRPGLREVSTVEECDAILGFCPVVYQAETDVTAALRQLHDVQGSKPVVLVVLHHTFDPETMVPDSSRSVTKKDTLAVDCLFHEDKGILCSVKNEEVFSRVSAWIEAQHSHNESRYAKHLEDDSQLKKFKNDSPSPGQTPNEHGFSSIKYVCIINEDAQEYHAQLLKTLQEEVPGLQEMSSVEECDVILAFCTVETSVDIEMELQRAGATKPAVIVVLHEMTDQERTIAGIRVNCLFHKDFGLLEYPVSRISHWLKAKGKEEEYVDMECEQAGGHH
ncbi:uncharacterized protein [Salminus brasiliensis]|uniref:uncharacterized protein isoform X2 n=1 Tax=Salminus brasiliensis TaxID=930266 RepID=UPI003B8376E1